MFQKKCCIVLLINLYQVLVACEAFQKSSIIVKLNVQPIPKTICSYPRAGGGDLIKYLIRVWCFLQEWVNLYLSIILYDSRIQHESSPTLTR